MLSVGTKTFSFQRSFGPRLNFRRASLPISETISTSYFWIKTGIGLSRSIASGSTRHDRMPGSLSVRFLKVLDKLPGFVLVTYNHRPSGTVFFGSFDGICAFRIVSSRFTHSPAVRFRQPPLVVCSAKCFITLHLSIKEAPLTPTAPLLLLD
jgi:hypothetical protein